MSIIWGFNWVSDWILWNYWPITTESVNKFFDEISYKKLPIKYINNRMCQIDKNDPIIWLIKSLHKSHKNIIIDVTKKYLSKITKNRAKC